MKSAACMEEREQEYQCAYAYMWTEGWTVMGAHTFPSDKILNILNDHYDE